MADKQKFPSEIIDLPSGGKLYGKDNPLSSGKIEIKYMTAKEEDILTSQNLIKKGVVLDVLLDSLILTEGIKSDDLLLGDKNGIMIASRILAYGPEYLVEIQNPVTGEKFEHNFNLADCPFKELPNDVDYSVNEFIMELPISKSNIKYKLLTGVDEKNIIKESQARMKFGQGTSEITTRLKHSIIEVDGKSEIGIINTFVDNMLSKDSLALRNEMNRITPDIILIQDIEMEGEMVKVNIPMTTNFFWPDVTA